LASFQQPKGGLGKTDEEDDEEEGGKDSNQLERLDFPPAKRRHEVGADEEADEGGERLENLLKAILSLFLEENYEFRIKI
jgi:hypothetical protein